MSQAVELLQSLIRNRCVNDGVTPAGEDKNAETLQAAMPNSGFDAEVVSDVPGRASLVCRIAGSDPAAESLMLMGHTDVVPVGDETRWKHDPFGGELVDGEVWGRGAVDMLDVTSAMAVAFGQLASEGFKPKGDLVYLAVADEEALGKHGAEFLVRDHADLVAADVVLTEFGGMRFPLGSPDQPLLPVMVGEKGTAWALLRVQGTPGHASMPFRSDNALVTAARVIERLDAYVPATVIHEMWKRFVLSLGLGEDFENMMLDPGALDGLIDASEDLGLARMLHSCTHTTFAPTVIGGTVKTNVIPDKIDIDIDIRTVPGDGEQEVTKALEDAIGDLWDRVELIKIEDSPPSVSEYETRAWDVISEVTAEAVPGAKAVPFMIVGATDARFFRRAGATAYGTGLKSDRIPFAEFAAMFHGDNERVDVDSVELQVAYFKQIAERFLG